MTEAGPVDREGHVLHRQIKNEHAEQLPEVIVTGVARVCGELLEAAGVTRQEIAAGVESAASGTAKLRTSHLRLDGRAVLTIADMSALTASGSVGHASITVHSCALGDGQFDGHFWDASAA